MHYSLENKLEVVNMILVTGGLGYIGSHTVLTLLENKQEVVIVDNLYNSSKEVHNTLENISKQKIPFYEIDCCDKVALEKIFQEHSIKSCIHFCAYKAVGESSEKPLEYYSNNLISTLNVLELLKKYKAKNFIFSSSATVYGSPERVPITEDFPLSVTNPYGRTKLMIEDMLRDLAKAEPDWSIGLLRYFNPIGAHKSGLIGDNPNGIPNNVMPYISRVASGKLPCLPVFGNDYDTKDGTGVRDYIHVMDLAKGHSVALNYIANKQGLFIYNLGTGNGYSVLDLVEAFKKVSGKDISYEIKPRRAGDIAICYADASKAFEELGWKCEYGLEEMIEDTWNFEQKAQN